MKKVPGNKWSQTKKKAKYASADKTECVPSSKPFETQMILSLVSDALFSIILCLSCWPLVLLWSDLSLAWPVPPFMEVSLHVILYWSSITGVLIVQGLIMKRLCILLFNSFITVKN